MGTLAGLGLAALVFVASILSVELGISVAIMEIGAGVLAGNLLGMGTTPWIDYLAGLAAILLTFLAGAEVDTALMRQKFKESMLIGILSFLVPFMAAFVFARYAAGWTVQASLIAGTALSTTSLAVVYAVLVETGLTETELGKIIMASCFVTDLGTALALSILFAQFNWLTLLFVAASAVLIALVPRLAEAIFSRYGGRVIEPEIKFLLLVLAAFICLAQVGSSHAVLPAFVFGLAMSRLLAERKDLQRRVRVLSFALLTPFFFIKAGMNVSLGAVAANAGLLAVLLGVKIAAKVAGVLPLARVYVPQHATYTTLLMSTGLTFGTISAMFGLTEGYIDGVQFSLLVATVVLSAVIPTVIAQRYFDPRKATVPGIAQPAPLPARSGGGGD